MTWAEGGHVPAWLPFATATTYKKLTPQSNYAAAADAAVYDRRRLVLRLGLQLRDHHRLRHRRRRCRPARRPEAALGQMRTQAHQPSRTPLHPL